MPGIWSTRSLGLVVFLQVFSRLWRKAIQELYADPTKHFTDEELKVRDANIKIGEEVGVVDCCCGRLGRAFPLSKSETVDAQDLMKSSPVVPWCSLSRSEYGCV